jgi:hypothetical protein
MRTLGPKPLPSVGEVGEVRTGREGMDLAAKHNKEFPLKK